MQVIGRVSTRASEESVKRAAVSAIKVWYQLDLVTQAENQVLECKEETNVFLQEVEVNFVSPGEP